VGEGKIGDGGGGGEIAVYNLRGLGFGLFRKRY